MSLCVQRLAALVRIFRGIRYRNVQHRRGVVDGDSQTARESGYVIPKKIIPAVQMNRTRQHEPDSGSNTMAHDPQDIAARGESLT
jgi:hypothetical protein